MGIGPLRKIITLPITVSWAHNYKTLERTAYKPLCVHCEKCVLCTECTTQLILINIAEEKTRKQCYGLVKR